MTPSPWLAEFHRRWQAARGKRTTESSRAFGVGWSELLEGAGIRSSEDEKTAQREVEAFGRSGHLVLKRHRSKSYFIERISLPTDSEGWLRELFGSADPGEMCKQSLALVAASSNEAHPLWPDEWHRLCDGLEASFTAGKSPRPFVWHQPENLRWLLRTLHGLSAREWEPGTPVRTASVALGLDSKALERHRRGLDSGLSRLFGSATTLDDLGLVTSESMIVVHGLLELCFADRSRQAITALAAPYSLSFADLQRATDIRTTATRLLTVENSKTTFRQLAAADPAGGTLIVASSFPTPALKELLAKLPRDLPHHHFGDTDPSGWLILQKLRECSPRPVLPFRMNERPRADSPPLGVRDRMLLSKLLDSPEMADCHGELEAIAGSGHRGDFEQESLGPPDLQGWPFFR